MHLAPLVNFFYLITQSSDSHGVESDRCSEKLTDLKKVRLIRVITISTSCSVFSFFAQFLNAPLF